MPILTLLHLFLRKLIGVIIHNVHTATGTCDSEEGSLNLGESGAY